MPRIKIAERYIGDSYPCYTIAEAGANHDGELEKALKLIDAAYNANADSIKFQTYKASRLTTKTAPKYWDDGKKNETQFDVFSRLDHLNENEWKQIFEYAKKKEITCFSTPFDEESVDLLYSFDVPTFKIASADITHIPLIKYIAKKKLPTFISTGMASEKDIDEAIETIENEGNHEIIILHCITSYPTKPEDANLETIRTLKQKFPNYVIGFSDHTPGTTVALCSMFYGANCIEKHFTYDNKLTNSPDHRLSLSENEFGLLVKQLRIAEISKGKSRIGFIQAESEAVKYARRSLVSKMKIPKGAKISKDMLTIKRPGTGILPKYLDDVVGKAARIEIDEDKPITWQDLD